MLAFDPMPGWLYVVGESGQVSVRGTGKSGQRDRDRLVWPQCACGCGRPCYTRGLLSTQSGQKQTNVEDYAATNLKSTQHLRKRIDRAFTTRKQRHHHHDSEDGMVTSAALIEFSEWPTCGCSSAARRQETPSTSRADYRLTSRRSFRHNAGTRGRSVPSRHHRIPRTLPRTRGRPLRRPRRPPYGPQRPAASCGHWSRKCLHMPKAARCGRRRRGLRLRRGSNWWFRDKRVRTGCNPQCTDSSLASGAPLCGEPWLFSFFLEAGRNAARLHRRPLLE